LRSGSAWCGEVRGVGRRGLVADRGVRSGGVVVVDPGRELLAGVIETEEQGLVQQLVAHPPSVMRLDRALARKDAGPQADAARSCPPHGDRAERR
jgi:hypothetical protein